MAKIVLDLHDCFSNGSMIDAELNRVINDTVNKRIALVEIISGKGSGQIKKLYHRLEKADKNFGRIFVHFKH